MGRNSAGDFLPPKQEQIKLGKLVLLISAFHDALKTPSKGNGVVAPPVSWATVLLTAQLDHCTEIPKALSRSVTENGFHFRPLNCKRMALESALVSLPKRCGNKEKTVRTATSLVGNNMGSARYRPPSNWETWV